MSSPHPALRTDLAVGVIVGIGVLVAGAVDWAQGQPPQSPLPSWLSGFGVFAAALVASVVLVTLVGIGRLDPAWRYGALAAATVAVAAADPTYASLLYAAPLIEIGRRAPDPERWLATGATLAVVGYLLATEPTTVTSAEMEAMFVLAIGLAIVVLYGHALRRNDEARLAEARLARADERNRLAQNLHDSLGHHLLATSIQLRSASALLERDQERAGHAIDLASQAVAEALADTRFAVDNVRADSAGFSLERSLPQLIERVTPPSMAIELEVTGDHGRLDALTQITLYRFAQEALTNIVRHAEATTASVNSTAGPRSVQMVICDDGLGFDEATATDRTGLDGMRDRLARIGGQLDVVSERQRGTTLRASIGLGS